MRRIALDIENEAYRILLDKRWKLEELHQYTKNFDQAYFAYFALFSVSKEENKLVFERVSRTLTAYPWKGGYSVVSFYTGLKRTIGRRNLPEVKAIKYASPGFMDIVGQLPVIVQIAGVVSSIAFSLASVNKVYNDIYKGIRERKLNEIEVERAELNLSRENLEFLKEACHALAQPLQIDDVDTLIEMSGNELRALKVLQSIYRRVRILANYQNEGKATLLLSNPLRDEDAVD